MLVPSTHANGQLVLRIDLKKGLSKFPKKIKKTLRTNKKRRVGRVAEGARLESEFTPKE